jgi:hypothetical protein
VLLRRFGLVIVVALDVYYGLACSGAVKIWGPLHACVEGG